MANQRKKQLGQILVEAGKINDNQLEEALTYKQSRNIYLGKAIIELGLLTEKEMIQTLGNQLNLPYLDLLNYEIDPEVLERIDETIALKQKIMPLFELDSILTVAIGDPLNIEVIDDISDKTGMEVNLVLATESDIEQAIDLYYSAEKFISKTGGKADKGARIVSKEIDEETEIVEAVDMLFNEAIKMGASDVHIEPREKDVRIRFRVDGVLQQYYTIPKSSMAPMISRVKILANMDIAESRVPQDGRFSHNANGKKVDVRASTFPAAMGEKVVLRILDESRGRIELHKLGFSEDIIKIWRKVIRNPNGIVLVSGPTGSGKTTTLYATMNIVNTVEVNIMTIEDPIEYQLDNINQAQVNPRAGLTFSTALRSMLRQDPDILMVGEMRDVETIEIAVRAALTGHLVFSTIHTNDAASTFTRLLDMGLDSFLISSSIRAVLAQRLIRILCPRCKLEIEPTDALLESIGVDGKFTGKLYNATGCAHCKNSGYHGRAGVYELLIPNEEITDLINKHATATEIKKIAEKNGMTSLTKSALVFVNKGLTSVEEMIRITMG
ncbi:MAG: Flp pilus assembly complex ATPase component TadA [Candidatus Marinimicrobia bacterium]|nr:Flp pilus assembly complex ATPase component TadA [Candidatus Neomarinimicrobiota bacterium]